MKKSILTITGMSLVLSLVACGPAQNQIPTPSASPSVSTPVATPTPAETAMPVPTAVPGTPAPIATPTPDPSADAQLTSAVATKNADFSYAFVLNGSGLGSLDRYQFLQVKMGPSTIPLVVDGQSKVNNVSLKSLEVAATKISFTWVPDLGAPTSGDEIEVTFEIKGDSSGRRSSKVRLTVN